jgi:hypothetical protein
MTKNAGDKMSRYQKLISTGIVLTVITGGVAGAVAGLALDSIVANKALLAVTAALLAVLVATAVSHFTIIASIRGTGAGPGTLLIPGVVLLNSVVASVVGGLAGYGLSLSVLSPPPSAWIGCLSGIIASVSMELLMIGYRATLIERQ